MHRSLFWAILFLFWHYCVDCANALVQALSKSIALVIQHFRQLIFLMPQSSKEKKKIIIIKIIALFPGFILPDILWALRNYSDEKAMQEEEGRKEREEGA